MGEYSTKLIRRLLPALVFVAAFTGANCCAIHAQDTSAAAPSAGFAGNTAYQSAMESAEADSHAQDLAPELLSYLAAIQAVPENGDAAANLFKIIAAAGMPHTLTGDQMRQIAQAPGPFTFAMVDRGVTLLRLDGSAGHGIASLTDPQNGWPFPAVVEVYAPVSDDSGRSSLICAIHYQTTDDADLAAHVGRLLVLLRKVLTQHSGHPPIYESPFNVWMSRSSATSPGGEQWRNNLYFYDIGDGRSSIEWIREIAHEYGHLALPPVGGDYTDPEAWANGYIGERLMVRWLTDPKVAGPAMVESAWGNTFSGYAAFKAKLIDPPLAAFLSSGLSRAALARNDAAGMRYVIGLLLWVDQTKGGKAVGDLLWNMNTPDPAELFEPAKLLGAPAPIKSAHAKMQRTS